jgi:type II secretion system protein H
MDKNDPDTPVFRHSNTPLSRGFTLIEILLVVVIILIATTIAVPRFSGTLKSTQMTTAVRSTIRTARYARSMAILRQEICTLRFKEHQLELSCGEPGNGETNSAGSQISRKLPDDIKIIAFENLAEQDRSPSADRIVRYYPTGMNDGFELTLSDGGARRSTITCNPISGKTTVEDDR